MDALVFYDVSTAIAVTTLDLGTVAAASSDDTQLRIYNTSGSYQANDVVVSVTGSNNLDLYLSTDGLLFTATAEVGDISPGGYSPVVWMRRITDHFASAGVRSATVQVTPGSWSNPTVDSGTSDITPLDTSDN